MSAARRHISRGLLGNSMALLAMTHVTAILGYAFWMVCARLASASDIGISNTVIAAMTLVAMLVVAGFIPLLTRILPGASPEDRSGLCSTAVVVTVILSGAAGAAAALLMPRQLHDAIGTGWLVALLAAGSIGSAMLLVVNAALLGVRRAELSLVGTVVGSVARLVVVAALLALGIMVVGDSVAHMILVMWVASLILSLSLSIWMLARATPGFRFHPAMIWFTRLRRSVGWDHIATLAVRSPPLVIPILAATLFPPAQVGYMTMAAMISSAFFAVASAVSNALLADCADDPTRLRRQARRAVWLIGVLLVVPVGVTCLLARQVLGFFGPDYAQYSTLLILLLLATFPDALINVAVAMLRVQRQLVAVSFLTVTGAVLTIGGAWALMPHLGITGAGWAALASQLIVAAVLAFVGYRRYLISTRSAGEPPGAVAAAGSPDMVAAGTPRPRKTRMGRP